MVCKNRETLAIKHSSRIHLPLGHLIAIIAIITITKTISTSEFVANQTSFAAAATAAAATSTCWMVHHIRYFMPENTHTD